MTPDELREALARSIEDADQTLRPRQGGAP